MFAYTHRFIIARSIVVDPLVVLCRRSSLRLLPLLLRGRRFRFLFLFLGSSGLLLSLLTLLLLRGWLLANLRRLLHLLLLFFIVFALGFTTGNRSLRITLIHQEEVARRLLDLILLRAVLVDSWAEVVRVTSERDVHHLEELVHAGDHALGRGRERLLSWLTAEYDNLVSQVSRHDEIVLNDEGRSLCVHNPAFHNARRQNTLFGVEVRGRLIDEIEVARLRQCDDERNTLQLTTRQSLHFVIEE